MISHSKKFIFRHIGKTGGTTIDSVLVKYAPKDTWRRTPRSLRGEGAAIKNKHASLAQLIPKQRGKKRYFRFTFVRNPWARVVSRYFYSIRRHDNARPKHRKRFRLWRKDVRPSFKKFVKMIFSPGQNINPATLKPRPARFRVLQSRHVTGLYTTYDNKGKFIKRRPYGPGLSKNEQQRKRKWIQKHTLPETGHLFDFVGQTHRMQEDMDIICKKIGIPKIKVPHINKSSHKHYTEYYDAETQKLVADYYKEDIDMFNFKFGK